MTEEQFQKACELAQKRNYYKRLAERLECDIRCKNNIEIKIDAGSELIDIIHEWMKKKVEEYDKQVEEI